MSKILLVEDQQTAAAYLSKGLGEAGLLVDVARNGPDGLHLLLTESYELAILDVMLPGLDGWAILELATLDIVQMNPLDSLADCITTVSLSGDERFLLVRWCWLTKAV